MKNEKKAVALRYPENAPAPFICASGKGELARRILEIAQENKIPIVHDENLANVLSVQEIGSFIPEQTWEAMAKIFAFVAELEDENEKFYKT